jgi:hypothetical protein
MPYVIHAELQYGAPRDRRDTQRRGLDLPDDDWLGYRERTVAGVASEELRDSSAARKRAPRFMARPCEIIWGIENKLHCTHCQLEHRQILARRIHAAVSEHIRTEASREHEASVKSLGS